MKKTSIVVSENTNKSGTANQNGESNQLNSQRLIEVYDLLQKNEETYWQTLEGLTNEQKVEIFVRILKKVPAENRSDYQLRFLSSICMQFEFFKNMSQNYGDQVVKDCARYLRYEDLQSEQVLFEQGDRGTRFYIILQGSVHVLIKLPEKGNVKKFKNQKINTINAGKAFGEVALMNEYQIRTATIKSAEYCKFAYLEKEDFKRIIGIQATEQINQRYMFIKDYNFFDEFTYRELITFSYHFNEATYKRGQVVYDIYDKKIDDVYFVKEGSFMLQGSFDFTESYIPNLKAKKQQKRTIFGLEHFNKSVIKTMHYAIKHLEEMSSAAIQQTKEQQSGISQNPENEEGEKLIPFQPYRIGRVICDSTRGTVYRVKASEIEQRLWKEDSKVKWNALSTLIFEKQSLDEKSHLDLLREQAKYLKPPVEYLGRKEELNQFYSQENHRNSQSKLSVKTQDQQKLEIRSTSPSILKNGGSPMNNNISILMDLDKFFKSSLDFGFSERSPFNRSLQKIKQTLQSSSGQSPSRLKSTIQPQPCIQNSTNSPRKPGKNVTINDLTTIETQIIHNNFSPLARRNNIGGSSLSNLNKSSKYGNHKNFSLCVFHADENNSSVILGSKRNTKRRVICEEESPTNNLGSSLTLFQKQPSKLFLRSASSVCSEDESHIIYHKERIESIRNEQEEEEDSLKKQKNQQKQCSPTRRSPEKQSIHEEQQLIKSERKFKQDFLKQISKNKPRASSTTRQSNNKNESQQESKYQDDQEKLNKTQHQNLIQENIKQDNSKQENSKQSNENCLSPKELLNQVFYFSHNKNKLFKREQEVQMMKKYFLGEDPEETNPSNVIRGNTDNGLNKFDKDLLEATTLDDYKRRKFKRKLLQDQENKFQKLFSNDLVELGKLNEHSLYNQKVKDLYIRNRKMNKIIFDKTAEVVKFQNCSYMQVREFYNKQDHKDRFFQDIYKKVASRLSSTKNINNISTRLNTDQPSRTPEKNSSQVSGVQTPSHNTQYNLYQKKASSQYSTPYRRRQSKLILKEKRSASQYNTSNFEITNSSQPNVSDFQFPQENISEFNQEIKKNHSVSEQDEEKTLTNINFLLKKANSFIESSKQQLLEINKNNLNIQQEKNQFQIQQTKDGRHNELDKDKEVILLEKKESEQPRNMNILKQQPGYLSYLLQKNIQSNQNKIEQKYENINQIESPLIISKTQSNQNKNNYQVNSSYKKQNTQQLELDKQKNDEQQHSDTFTIQNSNKIKLVHQTDNVQNNQQIDSQIQNLLKAKDISSLTQNHLAHIKYTPNYKLYQNKPPNQQEKLDDSKINILNDQIYTSIQTSPSQQNQPNKVNLSSQLEQKNQVNQENQINQESELKQQDQQNQINKLSQTNSQVNQRKQLNQSQYLKHKSKRHSQDSCVIKTQILSPIVVENYSAIQNRSFAATQSNYKPSQLSISYNNSSQKQEINVEDKNTFLSQNHRKYIINSRQQQRDTFLKSKSSVKRYSSTASTNFPDSNVFSSQVDVNSKCLAQIPSWNHRPSTSQTVRSFKKQSKIPKNRGPPRSLQIVSNNNNNNNGTSDLRLVTTISQDQSVMFKRINTDPFEDSNYYQKQYTQQSLHQNYSNIYN